MISGAQPFKALTSYLSMEKTRKAEYAFPEGFDPIARDLVENLLVLEPAGRLGDAARGGVSALRAHPFFAPIDWGTLWTSSAPVLNAGLVKREAEQEQRGVDEDHEGNATDIGAAWNALVRDLSEDEMGEPDDDDEQATIGDPSERLPQVDESTPLRFPSDDKDGASLEDEGTAGLISAYEAPTGAPVVPECPPLVSQSISLVSSDSPGLDAATKW
jgi:3-phosphoinositide dependent protein kinase-1